MTVLSKFVSAAEQLFMYLGNDLTLKRFIRQSLMLLVASGRRTISSLISAAGRSQVDWSGDYRLFNKSKWKPADLQKDVIRRAIALIEEDYDFIPVAVDDTKLRKTGRLIPNTSWQLDPKSPPFNRNFMWGQRLLHHAILIPYHKHNLTARAVPISLKQAPFIKKPGKRASGEEMAAYKQAQQATNLSTITVNELERLRKELDELGYYDKRILEIGDGSFSNKTVIQNLPERTDILARVRKDIKLCRRSTKTGRFYSRTTKTAAEFNADEKVPIQSGEFFYGGEYRRLRYKEVRGVYSQRSGGRRRLRLIIIKGTPFRKVGKNGKINYKNPIHLITTDLSTPAGVLIQMYLNRWEIEVAHRDMKNDLGLGQQQVWSEISAERAPQFVAITYAWLLLAVLESVGARRDQGGYIQPPKWYRKRRRPSVQDMLRKIREDLHEDPIVRERYGIYTNWQTNMQSAAA